MKDLNTSNGLPVRILNAFVKNEGENTFLVVIYRIQDPVPAGSGSS